MFTYIISIIFSSVSCSAILFLYATEESHYTYTCISANDISMSVLEEDVRISEI